MSHNRATLPFILAPIILLVLLLLIPTCMYVVDQREMAVVLRFGNPVAERTAPGLYFKMPFVEEVRKLPSARQFWGDTHGAEDVLPDLPTKDNKKIQVVAWAVWRVQDPTSFVQRLRTMPRAELRVAQFVRSAIRDVVTQYDLDELVRSTNREMHTPAKEALEVEILPLDKEVAGQRDDPGIRVKVTIRHGRRKILESIKTEARRRMNADSEGGGGRGVELLDIGISHIEFVESVRQRTFDRWIAERQAISAMYVNQGEREKQELLNKTAAEVESIEGEGQQRSNEIRGEVDAEVIRRYAEAIQEAGEFYTFLRTLEAYKKAINADTRLILTTDSEFLRLLKRLDDAPPAAETTETTETTEATATEAIETAEPAE